MENGSAVPYEIWASRFDKIDWDRRHTDKQKELRYSILSTMLAIKPGDVLVIPKQPDDHQFATAIVKSKYDFDRRPESERGVLKDDFRHFVEVQNIRVAGYTSSREALVISNMFRSYRRAVNNAWSDEFVDAVDAILKKDANDLKSVGLERVLKDSLEPTVAKALDVLRKMKPLDLEKTILGMFDQAGYTVEGVHKYDRKGGDIDVKLSYGLPVLEGVLDEDGSIVINIQVKQKKGIDTDDSVGVEQLVRMADEGDINILASTADDFTSQCKAKAASNNVTLVNGHQMARLFVRSFG